MDVLTVPKAPIVSLGGKWTTPATFSEKVPGPGNYATIGGIGQMNPQLRSSQRSSFGKEMRKAMGSATDTPGPGQYHLGSQLGRQRLSTRPSSPASSLGGRTAIAYKQADVMGPGVCREDSFLKPSSSPNKQWAPQYTFGLKTPITTNDGTEVPGPGARGAARHATLADATSTRARARGLRPRGTHREHATRPSMGRNDADATERFEAPPDRSAPTVAPRAGTSRAAPRGTRAVGPTSTGARAAVAARRARRGALDERRALASAARSFARRARRRPVDASPTGGRRARRQQIVRRDPTKPLAPSFSLSGRHVLAGNNADVVGPGRCRTDSSLGMQKVSTQKNYPAFSFGRRTQVKSNASRYPSPGPGAYG